VGLDARADVASMRKIDGDDDVGAGTRGLQARNLVGVFGHCKLGSWKESCRRVAGERRMKTLTVRKVR
jgi:hypothetical protein